MYAGDPDLANAENVKFAADANADMTLEAPFTFTDGQYVHCAGDDQLVIQLKTYASGQFVAEEDYDSEWEYLQIPHYQWSCLGAEGDEL